MKKKHKTLSEVLAERRKSLTKEELKEQYSRRMIDDGSGIDIVKPGKGGEQ